MKAALLLLLMFLCSYCFCHAQGEPTNILTYKSVDDVTLELHVFSPVQSATPAPAVVFFFGGGWSIGSPKQFYTQCEHFRSKGLIAISAEYRIRNKHDTSPLESIEDAKSAIRYVREHAEQLGIDPNRIVASGGSAGGHIAACAAVVPGFEAEGEDHEISSVPDALILFNPALNIPNLPRFRDRFKGKAAEASPENFIREGLPPALILHGKADKLITYSSIERYCTSAKEKGNVCQLVGFQEQGHGFFNREPCLSETLVEADEFLKKIGILE